VNQRRGSEWEPIKILLEGDEGSNKMNMASTHVSDSTTQVGQDHVAIGVLLILGTNKQPSNPKLTNTHSGNLHGLLPVLHRSDRWPAPVRPVTRVRLVDGAGQAGGCNSRTTNVPESLGDFSRPWNQNKPFTNPSKSPPKQPKTDQQQHDPKTHGFSNSPESNPTKGSHQSDRSRAPVRPV
jgi:hypothetical protein